MKQINTYVRNTSIMMRLEVNYLVIATHIMLSLIAPPSLKCSTRWIVQPMSKNWKIQTRVTSWTIRNKMNNRLFYIKLNIELVLCFLTQIAREAEGPTQDKHK